MGENQVRSHIIMHATVKKVFSNGFTFCYCKYLQRICDYCELLLTGKPLCSSMALNAFQDIMSHRDVIVQQTQNILYIQNAVLDVLFVSISMWKGCERLCL